MTTDHDLIARACRLIPNIMCWEGDYEKLHCMVEGHYHPDYANSPALHALLVLQLARKTRACIDYTEGGLATVILRRGSLTSRYFLLEPIDIIRVLVDALEEGE